MRALHGNTKSNVEILDVEGILFDELAAIPG